MRKPLQIPGEDDGDGDILEGKEPLEVYQRARIALLSGIASVDEVLAWVHLLAAKDPEGNELDCVRALPQVRVSPIS